MITVLALGFKRVASGEIRRARRPDATWRVRCHGSGNATESSATFVGHGNPTLQRELVATRVARLNAQADSACLGARHVKPTGARRIVAYTAATGGERNAADECGEPAWGWGVDIVGARVAFSLDWGE